MCGDHDAFHVAFGLGGHFADESGWCSIVRM
jgi:hypothetical protein